MLFTRRTGATKPKRRWPRASTLLFLFGASLMETTFSRILAERTHRIFLRGLDKLCSGEKEASPEVGPKSWCIVKLEEVR